MRGDGLETLTALIDGHGPGARLRRWSAIVCAAMAVPVLIGCGLWFHGLPRQVDAAELEAGNRPALFYRSRGHTKGYEISGHLLEADAIVVREFRLVGSGRPRIYAPLVSGSSGPADGPRVYFGGSEAAYDRARAEKRFVGTLLDYVPPYIRAGFADHGRTLPTGVWLLEDDRSGLNEAATGRGLLLFGLFGGLLSLVVFVTALRRNPIGRGSAP